MSAPDATPARGDECGHCGSPVKGPHWRDASGAGAVYHTDGHSCALALRAERDALTQQKDAAYEERNRVVAYTARLSLALGYRVMVTRTAIEGWSDDWHGCVRIDTPNGQASWHFHDSHAHLFADLPHGAMEWDGHTTEEKYERLHESRPENALAQRVAALEPLARFASRLLYHYQDHERYNIDGDEIQQWCIETGVMVEESRTVPCSGEGNCACADWYYSGETAKCFRIVDWLRVRELAALRATPTPEAT